MLLQAFIKKNIFKDAHSSSSQNIIIDIILEINIHVIVHNPLFPDSIFSFAKNQFFSRSQKCWPQPLSTSITGNARIYLEELCHWGHLHSTLNNFDDDDYIGLLNLPLWTRATGAGNIALPMDLASQLDTWWQSSTVHSYSDATCSSIDTSNI